jgi:vacuolar-type H+-ATPase subunit E/Vma4
LKDELNNAKVTSLRAELFSKSKLPNEMLSFISGKTEAEMQDQIDKLSNVLISQNKLVVPNEHTSSRIQQVNSSGLLQAVKEYKGVN